MFKDVHILKLDGELIFGFDMNPSGYPEMNLIIPDELGTPLLRIYKNKILIRNDRFSIESVGSRLSIQENNRPILEINVDLNKGFTISRAHLVIAGVHFIMSPGLFAIKHRLDEPGGHYLYDCSFVYAGAIEVFSDGSYALPGF